MGRGVGPISHRGRRVCAFDSGLCRSGSDRAEFQHAETSPSKLYRMSYQEGYYNEEWPQHLGQQHGVIPRCFLLVRLFRQPPFILVRSRPQTTLD